MTITKRWWVFWDGKTPWTSYSDSKYFENEEEAKAFCEELLEDGDVYEVRIEENLTYIKGKEERNEYYEY